MIVRLSFKTIFLLLKIHFCIEQCQAENEVIIAFENAYNKQPYGKISKIYLANRNKKLIIG